MTIERYIDVVVRETGKRHIPAICSKIKAGEYGCSSCGHIAPKSAFEYGRGRHVGEHPDQRFCPNCHCNIEFHGAVDGDVIARGKARQQEANRLRSLN